MATTDEVKSALSRNLRRLRTSRGWSLDELATRSGISRAMIVQVEGGRTNASLGTICELADALSVPVQSLIELSDESRVQVVTASETSLLWSDADGSWARLLCGTSTREKLELWSWRLAPAAEYTSKAHPHGTRELIWVMKGTLTLTMDGTDTTASVGDSIIFEADQQHTYRNRAGRPCEFAMIVQLGVA
jgi:transcriptional regulator with XRE-family HTH domain